MAMPRAAQGKRKSLCNVSARRAGDSGDDSNTHMQKPGRKSLLKAYKPNQLAEGQGINVSFPRKCCTGKCIATVQRKACIEAELYPLGLSIF